MEGSKKIIKPEQIKASGSTVRKVEIGTRRFGERVFKNIKLGEKTIEIQSPPIPEPESRGEVQLQERRSESGELIGLRITCRCGEVIELEFAPDEDIEKVIQDPGEDRGENPENHENEDV